MSKYEYNAEISQLMNIISSNINNKNDNNIDSIPKGKNSNILLPKVSKANQPSNLKNLIESNISSNHVKKLSIHSFKSILTEGEGRIELPPKKEENIYKRKLKQYNNHLESESDQIKSQSSLNNSDCSAEMTTPLKNI